MLSNAKKFDEPYVSNFKCLTDIGIPLKPIINEIKKKL